MEEKGMFVVSKWLKEATYLKDAVLLSFDITKKDGNNNLTDGEIVINLYNKEDIHLIIEDGARIESYIPHEKDMEEITGMTLRYMHEMYGE